MKRASGPDAAFLYGETPAWHMHVSSVLILDPSDMPGGFDVERLKASIGARLHLVPQFRWKLVETPFGLDRPQFIEDPNFDIDGHVRRVGLPSPGGREQLGNLVGDLIGIKLDRRKALWEFWVIEGLEDGRIALLAKVHHAIIDGSSGSELFGLIMDMAADAEPPPPPVEPRRFEREPSTLELLGRGWLSTVRTPLRMARFTTQTLRQGVTMLGFFRRPEPPAFAYMAPRTSFNGELSPHRRFSYAKVPLADVKRIRRAFGVKVNDVVLALVAGTLRRYLERRGELPDNPLIVQVPVSLRAAEDHEVGTKVGAMFASLATHLDDPATRLLAIHGSTQSAKEMREALAAEKIMGITETAPPALIGLAARMYTAAGLDSRTPPIMNLIVSNVPGPPFALYCAGARIEALYPMGPLLYGTGVNVTVFSYEDGIDFGFMTDRELVPDAWELAEGIDLALEELLHAADDHEAAREAGRARRAAPDPDDQVAID